MHIYIYITHLERDREGREALGEQPDQGVHNPEDDGQPCNLYTTSRVSKCSCVGEPCSLQRVASASENAHDLDPEEQSSTFHTQTWWF